MDMGTDESEVAIGKGTVGQKCAFFPQSHLPGIAVTSSFLTEMNLLPSLQSIQLYCLHFHCLKLHLYFQPLLKTQGLSGWQAGEQHFIGLNVKFLVLFGVLKPGSYL